MQLSLAWLPLLAVTLASDTGRPNHGLVGYGIEMYVPVCTYACASCFNGGPLWCNDTASMGSGMSMRLKRDASDPMPDMGMFSSAPSAVCLSGSVPYLTSTAWCIHVRCPSSIPAWQVEKWWDTYVVGRQLDQPAPLLTYGAALALVTEPPNVTATEGVNITKTVLADPTLYTALYNSLDVNQNIEIQHETFALVVFLSGICIPVGFSLLRFLPSPRRWTSWFYSRFVYPSLFRPWRDSPIASVAGNPPTVGQAFFIAYLIILNIFLSAFQYQYNPLGWNYWYDDGPDEIMGDLANRLGVLGFANFALLVLYSSRNNLLLWLTDWDFSTFLLMHRWLARIAVLETILHSLIFLRDYAVYDRLADQVTPYWYYGCIGTIAASLLLPLSIPFLRLRHYEIFLALHVAFSILVFVGSWYHIIYRYEHQWGYETWMYVVFAVWAFDRLLRLLHILRNGLRTAVVTQIDADYVRLDVRGPVAAGHVYLYFLNWRVWENHPFSVASSVIHLGDADTDADADASSTENQVQVAHKNNKEDGSDLDPEAEGAKADPQPTATTHARALTLSRRGGTVETGMVFYVRLHEGGTAALRHKKTLPMLIEGPYGRHEDLSAYPTLVAIAGGVGVTSVLPYLRAHPGDRFLYFGARSQALVDSLRPLTGPFRSETVVGQRLALRDILEGHGDNFVVVVSGPQGMMDEVRGIVSGLSRDRNIKFVAESFNVTW